MPENMSGDGADREEPPWIRGENFPVGAALHPGGDGSTPGRAASGWGASMEAVGVPEERC